MSSEQWGQVSRVLDFVMQQKDKTESPGAKGVVGEPEKPKRKPKKKDEHLPEQFRGIVVIS
jgi:hypothetical protein